MTAPATLLPALGAGAVAAAYEYSKGQGVNEESIALVGGVAAAALGLSIAAEEGDLVYGPLLAVAGATAVMLLLRR
jgi:hypothetical protein